MPVRECDDCPWAYSCGYTEEWGCLLFGKECEKCKKYDRDVGGCYYSQKKLERLAYEYKKACRHAQKIAEGYCPYFHKPRTEKTPIFSPNLGLSYKVVGHERMFCKNYMPNRKGGHRHNHVRNAMARMRRCKECGDPIVKGMEARIELPLVSGRDDTMCRRCLRMLDEEIYHHNYLTVKEIEMMEDDL